MEKETRPFIPWQLADDFMTAVFEKVGVPEADARLCSDVLLESDRRGIESHGCNRFKPIYIDRIKAGILNPVTKIDIIKETPTTAVIDANDGMGMVASKKAMDMCIEKAHKYGMGMVAVRNSSHYGIAGYWTGLATKENMIGISGTNARPSVAPTFGVENMLGTNPLTFSLRSILWHSACLQMSHSRSCWTVQHLLSRTARSNTTHVSDTILLKVLLFPEKVRSLQTALRSSRRSAANRLHLLLSADLARQTEDIKDMDTPQLLRSFPQHFSPVSS